MTVLLIVPAWSVLLLLVVGLCAGARRGDLAMAREGERRGLETIFIEDPLTARPRRGSAGLSGEDREAAGSLERVAA